MLILKRDLVRTWENFGKKIVESGKKKVNFVGKVKMKAQRDERCYDFNLNALDARQKPAQSIIEIVKTNRTGFQAHFGCSFR